MLAERLQTTTDNDLAGQVRDLFASPQYRPPVLPKMAVQLLRLTWNENIEIHRIVSLLEQDPTLTGRVMALVQSPFYAGASQIRTLRQAIVRLGLRTLRQAVMEVALDTAVFKAGPYRRVMSHLSTHSRAAAHFAHAACKGRELDSDLAFMMGLFHDVGYAGLLILLTERQERTRAYQLPDIWPQVYAAHEQTSELMARFWGLDPEICRVIGQHHQIPLDGTADPYLALTYLAHVLAADSGFAIGMATPDLDRPARIAAAMAALGIDDDGLEVIRQDGYSAVPPVV